MYNHNDNTSIVNQQLHDVNPSPCQELPPTTEKERRVLYSMLDPPRNKETREIIG